MRVLVTGGTGVVGTAAVQTLLAHGHVVRLLSRHAADDAKQWPHRVEAFPGDIADAASLAGSADGCDVVLHLAAIVEEHPPEVTFERVNVGGTRHVVREAERAGVARLVHVSSLGCDHGDSPYHRSKREAERAAQSFAGSWTILRPGNVYGTGDEQISLMLQMVRSLPAVPVLGGESTRFQPIWADDFADAIVQSVERNDLGGRVLELAGEEQISVSELVDRISRITGRNPIRLPLPGPIAGFVLRIAEMLGVSLPVNSGQLTMLDEGNVIASPAANALTTVFGITPTPLDGALRQLADAQPEKLPEEGVGALSRKRFWAEIAGSSRTAEELFEEFRTRFSELTPWHVDVGAEPGTPVEPRVGETLTLGLPLRGNVQVRVEEITPRRMTFVTLAGHPLAGAVRFLCEPRGDRVRFEVQVYDRAANVGDWLILNPVGAQLQNATWRQTVESVIKASGGRAPDGVQQSIAKLDDDEAARVNEWLDELVAARKRAENEARTEGDERTDAEVAREVSREGRAASSPPSAAPRTPGTLDVGLEGN